MALDLTTYPVQIAVVATGVAPTTTDYVAAGWTRAAPTQQKQPLYHLSSAYRFIKVTATVVDLADSTTSTDSAYVYAKLGPDGVISPVAGINDVWAHVGDSTTSEDLYFKVGTLTVT